ncbi:MAG TPA: alcohol dehydrogenase [Gammaproteobacteria bacterium]|jgi:NAD(P)-dependent dehydrogenase (short-subunit alcohol dehydrogenase family)|nr:alcohol dehydrogenase [Gammaproteobacteria bacterium]
MTYANALVTGNSSGLGLGFTRVLLEAGTEVYGLSRRGCPLEHTRLHDQRADLSELAAIPDAVNTLLSETTSLDLVLLNAGLLGDIQDLHTTPVSTLEDLMRVNVWANKVLLDALIACNIPCKQIVLISSGAAVNGNRGWGGYSLSKATLNMLTMLYAHEMPDSHFCALAPGLVDTAMQDYLCDPSRIDAKTYTSLARLRAARGTDAMPGPDDAAKTIINSLPLLQRENSGSFIDIRTFTS